MLLRKAGASGVLSVPWPSPPAEKAGCKFTSPAIRLEWISFVWNHSDVRSPHSAPSRKSDAKAGIQYYIARGCWIPALARFRRDDAGDSGMDGIEDLLPNPFLARSF